MTIKKIIGLIHLWLGLSTGIVVFILGITGCLFCFEREIKSVIYANKLYISPNHQPCLPLDSLFSKAQLALDTNTPIKRIEIQTGKENSYRFISSKYNKEAWNYADQFPYHKTVYVNPFTGKVLDVENTKYEFFNLILYVHYNLLLGNIGHQIVGWSTVIFIIILITGIVLWWPKNKKAIKQRLGFQWKEKTKWKRKNYDLHNIPGFYSLFLALCISLTGLYFAFDWFRPAVYWTANGFKIPERDAPIYSDTLLIQTTSGLLQKTYSTTLKKFPNRQQILIILPETSDKKSPIRVQVYHNPDNYLKCSSLAFDQKSGKLLKDKPYEKLTGAEKFVSAMYDVHVGRILGIPGMILAFIASLVAASLPFSGFLIWFGRNKKDHLMVKKIS